MLPKANRTVANKIGAGLLKVLGWKVTGALPHKSKVIFAVAPHTSNWDFVIGVAAMYQLDLKISFLGKSAIFFWPLKPWLESIGGIPVDRSSAHGVVGQMVDKFEHSEALALALAPEGTRSKIKQWKTGFLHIAHQANVPVVPVSLDFKLKEVRFHPERSIGDDIDDELASIKQIFTVVCAKNPQAF